MSAICLITARVRSTREGNIYTWKCLSVPGPGPGRGVPGPGPGGGGYPVSGSGGRVGVPGPDPGKKEYPVSGSGGSQVQVGEGVPGPGPGGRGVPSIRFGGVPGLRSGGGYRVSVKGKIFDTRFGLIHTQTGKKIFCQGTPPPQ